MMWQYCCEGKVDAGHSSGSKSQFLSVRVKRSFISFDYDQIS